MNIIITTKSPRLHLLGSRGYKNKLNELKRKQDVHNVHNKTVVSSQAYLFNKLVPNLSTSKHTHKSITPMRTHLPSPKTTFTQLPENNIYVKL